MSSEEKAEEDKAPNASVKSTDVPIDPETEASTHNVKRGEGESENESSKKTKKESKDKDKSKSSGKSKKSRKSKGDKESKKSKSSKKDRDKSSRSKSSKHKRDKTRSRDKDRDTKPERRARKRKRSRSPSLHSRSRSPPHRRRRRSPPSRSPYSRHRYSRYSRSPSPYRSFRGDYRSRDRHYRREYRDRDYPRDRDYDRRRRNRDKRSRSRSPRRHRSNSKSSSSSSSDSKSKKDEANPNGSKAAEIKATAPNSLQQISDPAQAQRVMAQSNPLAAFNSVFGNLARAQQLGQQGLMQQLLSGNNPLLMSKIAQELQKTAVEQQTKNAAASLAATTATGLADQSMLFKVHLPGMRSVTAIGGINPQMTRPARRLYVGNLPCGMGLNEQILCEFFGQCCKGLGIATPNPVLSVWLNGEQTFGFIEFRSVQDTNLALQLFEGLQLGGRQLRFGRPVDYKEPPENLKEYVVGEEGDGPNGATNCIEEGSPAAMLLAQQKQQLAMHSAFGLAQVQQQLAEKKRLDLEIMNRQRLMLQRMMGVDTTNTAQLTAAAVMAAQGLGAAAAGLATAGGTAMNVDGVEEEKSVVETKVLMLVNMFKEEDIKEEAEYVDIKDDVKCECQQFGNLVDVVMPKVGEPGCGRVFLKYESVEGAKKCLAKVHGRKFGPNTVEVVYFDEKLFDEKKYGHEM